MTDTPVLPLPDVATARLVRDAVAQRLVDQARAFVEHREGWSAVMGGLDSEDVMLATRDLALLGRALDAAQRVVEDYEAEEAS